MEARQISMTLPGRVMASVKAQADELGLSEGEMIKHWVIASYTQPGGVTINLLPTTPAGARDHPELPLGGIASAV